MDDAQGGVEGTEVDTTFVERCLAAPVIEEESRRISRQPDEVPALQLVTIRTRMARQQPVRPLRLKPVPKIRGHLTDGRACS